VLTQARPCFTFAGLDQPGSRGDGRSDRISSSEMSSALSADMLLAVGPMSVGSVPPLQRPALELTSDRNSFKGAPRILQAGDSPKPWSVMEQTTSGRGREGDALQPQRQTSSPHRGHKHSARSEHSEKGKNRSREQVQDGSCHGGSKGRREVSPSPHRGEKDRKSKHHSSQQPNSNRNGGEAKNRSRESSHSGGRRSYSASPKGSSGKGRKGGNRGANGSSNYRSMGGGYRSASNSPRWDEGSVFSFAPPPAAILMYVPSPATMREHKLAMEAIAAARMYSHFFISAVDQGNNERWEVSSVKSTEEQLQHDVVALACSTRSGALASSSHREEESDDGLETVLQAAYAAADDVLEKHALEALAAREVAARRATEQWLASKSEAERRAYVLRASQMVATFVPATA
jgi:hypothetical protein